MGVLPYFESTVFYNCYRNDSLVGIKIILIMFKNIWNDGLGCESKVEFCQIGFVYFFLFVTS